MDESLFVITTFDMFFCVLSSFEVSNENTKWSKHFLSMPRPHIKTGERFHIFIRVRQYIFVNCWSVERDASQFQEVNLCASTMYSNKVHRNTNYNDHLQEAIRALNIFASSNEHFY